MRLIAASLLIALCAPARAAAQDSADALGFGEHAPATFEAPSAPSAPAAEDSPWTFAASLRLQSALRIERAQPSRLAKLRYVIGGEVGYRRALSTSAAVRAELGGRVEHDLAYELYREHWDDATLDTYELQLLWGDAFAALELESLELSTGKQIVNIGQGEVLGVLDTVNPRDQREPAGADAEELRLSVWMTRASLSRGPHRAELIIVHEPYFGLLPPPLGEQSGIRKLLIQQPGGDVLSSRELSYRHVPDRDVTIVSAAQPYARITVVGEGFDLGFLAASLLDPIGVARLPGAAAFAAQDLALVVHHPRFARMGQSGAVPFSSFVLRWEAAFDAKRPLTLLETDNPFSAMTSVRRDQLSALLGLSYVPAPTTSASVELQQSYVLDHPVRDPHSSVRPLLPIEAPQLALRLDHGFLRDRASFQLVLLLVGVDPFNAFVARGQLDYELSPGVRASVGFIAYAASARELGPFYGLGGNDRVFSQLRWDL